MSPTGWATTLPEALAPSARVAVQYGRGRWQIENEGFNKLSNHWHADHYFHHRPLAHPFLCACPLPQFLDR